MSGGEEDPAAPLLGRLKRAREDQGRESSSSDDEDESSVAHLPGEAVVDVAISPSSPSYSPSSPQYSSNLAADFSADVMLAVNRFERAARGEFRSLLRQGFPVQGALDCLLAKLSTGMRGKPSTAEIDGLVQQTGLDPETASWALMLREELTRLRRCGTPPPDSVDVLTARLQNSNLDVEPVPPYAGAVPAAAALPVVPAAAEPARKRASDAPVSSLEEETQKRRREEKDRMGAVLDAVAAAVRANNPVAPASPPQELLSALLRRSSQSELDDEDDASRKRRGGIAAPDDVRMQKKTRSVETIAVRNQT